VTSVVVYFIFADAIAFPSGLVWLLFILLPIVFKLYLAPLVYVLHGVQVLLM